MLINISAWVDIVVLMLCLDNTGPDLPMVQAIG